MKNLVLLCFLLLPAQVLYAQPGPQRGGLLIKNLYFQQGRKLVHADSSMVSVRRFLLTNATVDSPVASEWSDKAHYQDRLSGFVWLPPDYLRYSSSRLCLQRSGQQMIVDFIDVYPANPASDTEVIDTLVFKPGYFRVRLGQVRSQGHEESIYMTWPRWLVQRATTCIRRTNIASLLP